MADNLGIDWSLSNPNAFAKGWSIGQAMNDQMQANQARKAVLADPTNQDAMRSLAVYDPDAAKNVQANADWQRMNVARQAAATYTADPSALNGSVLAGADPTTYHNVTQAIGMMDSNQRQKVADSMGFLGSAAQSLLALPQAQRVQALQAMAPQLAQHGIGPQQIQQYAQMGLTDQQLSGFINQAVGVKDSIINSQNQQRIGIEQNRLTEDMRHNRVEESKGVQDGFGNIINPTTGGVIYSASAPTTLADMAGAIASAEGQGQNPRSTAQGYGQFTNGTFVQQFRKSFPDQAGLTDQAILAKRGSGVEQKMLQDMTGSNAQALSAAGYTPSAGNVYLAHFLGLGDAQKVLGADPSTPIAKVLSPKVIQANPFLNGKTVADVEQWANGRMMTGGGGSGGLSKKAVDAAADWAIANGGQVPTGYARNKAAQVAIQNRIAERASELGLTMEQIIQKGQDTKAAAKTLQSFTNGTDARTIQALNNATNHLATLGHLADALDNGNIPLANRIGNAWASATGKAAPTNFNAAKQLVAGELVKAVTGAGGALGDREEYQKALSSIQSPAQLRGAIATVKDLLGSQLHTLELKYNVGTGRTDFARRLTPLVRASWDVQNDPNAPAPPQIPMAAAGQSAPSVSIGSLHQNSDGTMEWRP